MCGRIACTLGKDGIIRACQCSLPPGKGTDNVKWLDLHKGQEYYPKYNLTPGTLSPVLVANHRLDKEPGEEGYYVCPMRWGLVPHWFKGKSPAEYTYQTINCRSDGILSRPTYSGPMKNGNRCVILADGFYEWRKESNGTRQPYLIYFPVTKNVKAENSTPKVKKEIPELIDGWRSPSILMMAGIYDTWTTPQGDELYSFTVITVDASSSISWIHHRMPAILGDDHAVHQWLDSVNVPAKEAVSLLKPFENLQWHAVSKVVNNAKNDTIACVLPVNIKPKARPKLKENTLTKWLQSSKRPSEENGSTSSPSKKLK